MWYPNATNKQILHNFTRGGMNHPLHGIVLHIMDGTLEGTYGWFNKTVEQRQADFDAQWVREGKKTAAPITAYASSAHFGNAVDGRLWQFLDTDHQAWAQGPGNADWISIENEGHGGDELSNEQMQNIARLMVWMLETDSVPLQVANSPSEYGLGFHSMSAGWGHPMCPGSNIIKQRDAIVERAQNLLAEDIRAIRSQSGPFQYEMQPREISVE